MIHFFLTFSKDAENSPFAERLRVLGVAYRIMAAEVRHRFRHRLWMVFVGRPQTAFFALRASFRSLVLSRPRPDAVVVWTHIEVLVIAFVRALFLRRDVRIVLVGFILTERRGGFHNWLRGLYFRNVLAATRLVVVHSKLEAERYSRMFAATGTRFVFIPWGSHIDDPARLRSDPPARPADVVCAGKSGRDYRTLYRALAGQPLHAKVICDLAEALQDCDPAANIEVLDRCYGAQYLRELCHAGCVVVPLAVDDISAGQMVLLQAMELGKAVIITRTATTVDYITDGIDALLVEPGDPDSLAAAVSRVLSDEALRASLGRNARQTFERRYTIPAFVDRLVEEVQRIDAGPGAPAAVASAHSPEATREPMNTTHRS